MRLAGNKFLWPLLAMAMLGECSVDSWVPPVVHCGHRNFISQGDEEGEKKIPVVHVGWEIKSPDLLWTWDYWGSALQVFG